VKPKGHLDPQKISNFVPKITGKSRYPKLMYKSYCLYPSGQISFVASQFTSLGSSSLQDFCCFQPMVNRTFFFD
jgi:hypothetical protein